MSKRQRLPTPSTSTGCGSSECIKREEAVAEQALKAAEDICTRMALCSCFSHISLNRNLIVEAWLHDRPWHGREVERRRCNEDSKGCALVLLRSIFHYVAELENRMLKQLLVSLSSTVFPAVRRCTLEDEGNDQEGFEKMLKLLAACSEPLESRAHIAGVLADRLRQCLVMLVEIADTGDAELADELRSWLATLDSADVLSRDSIRKQRCMLQQMATETWEVRRRREAVDFAHLG